MMIMTLEKLENSLVVNLGLHKLEVSLKKNKKLAGKMMTVMQRNRNNPKKRIALFKILNFIKSIKKKCFKKKRLKKKKCTEFTKKKWHKWRKIQVKDHLPTTHQQRFLHVYRQEEFQHLKNNSLKCRMNNHLPNTNKYRV